MTFKGSQNDESLLWFRNMTNLLLPDRHPNRDFFIAEIFDSSIPFKNDRASMEHPVFSLGTRPDMRVLEYERKGKWIKIHPSGYGLATIFDKDVLLYCGSLLMEQINQGEVPPKTLRFSAHDLLVKEYLAFCQAFNCPISHRKGTVELTRACGLNVIRCSLGGRNSYLQTL